MKKQFAKNSGMVLLVALVMVAIMSVIAVAAIKGSNMQEAMAGNLRDRNMAFQSAETALRTMEITISKVGTVKDNKEITALSKLNNNGFFEDQNKTATPINKWTLGDWGAKALRLSGVKYVASQPYAVSEMLSYSGNVVNSGGGIDFISQERTTEYKFFRVTSRAVGLTEQTEVILQSTYVR